MFSTAPPALYGSQNTIDKQVVKKNDEWILKLISDRRISWSYSFLTIVLNKKITINIIIFIFIITDGACHLNILDKFWFLLILAVLILML